MTTLVNVRTLARHQPLYIVLRLKQGPVFLVNSRQSSLVAPRREVGEGLSLSYARCFAEFLKEGFSRTPWYTLPAYLCRFAVRILFIVIIGLFSAPNYVSLIQPELSLPSSPIARDRNAIVI
jgi:hypothetical protein